MGGNTMGNSSCDALAAKPMHLEIEEEETKTNEANFVLNLNARVSIVKSVSFSRVDIRHFNAEVGYSPRCDRSPKDDFEWLYFDDDAIEIDQFEYLRHKRFLSLQFSSKLRQRDELLNFLGSSPWKLKTNRWDVSSYGKENDPVTMYNNFFGKTTSEHKKIFNCAVKKRTTDDSLFFGDI